MAGGGIGVLFRVVFWKILSIGEIIQAIRLSGDAASYAFFSQLGEQNICLKKKKKKVQPVACW